MNDPLFIVNFVFWLSLVIGIGSLLGILLIIRRQPGYVPKSALSIIGMIVLMGLAGFSTYVFTITLEIKDSLNQITEIVSDQLDEPAPELTFTSVDGETEFQLSEFSGDVILLNFWATWCAPCITELPELVELHDTYSAQGFRVIAISDETREIVARFSQQHALPGLNGLIDRRQEIDEPFRHMRQARPVSFVIDRDGTLRHAIVGARSYSDFESLITPYL